MEEGNEDDNTDEEVAYGHLVYVEADVDVDTYMGRLQGAHLEDDSADAEAGDMGSHRQLGTSVDIVVGLLLTVVDGERKVEEDVLLLLGCMDQLTIGSETQVVDLALSPLIASY